MDFLIVVTSKDVKSRIIEIFFVICYTFLTSCSNSLSPCTLKEKEQEEVCSFIRRFFIEEGAAYTLFGEKPMTDIAIFCGSEEDICLDGLSQEALDSLSYQEDFTFNHWKSWCNFIKEAKSKNYVFFTRQSLYDPLILIYGIVNIEQFKKVYFRYEEEFKKIDSSMTCSRALEELQQPQSFFWNDLFKNHYLSGLCYGYGQENAKYFSEIFQTNQAPEKFPDNQDEGIMQLPIYAFKEKDRQEESYKKQKKFIENLYKDQDLLKLTMKKLFRE